MSGLCECGCGKPTGIATETSKRNGHVKGKPYRYATGHNGTKTNLTRYQVDPSSGCWIWPIVSRVNRGYPTAIKWRGTRTTPYRAIWQETFQLRIPADLQLDHLCRNPACVNPDHLEVVTAKENMRRRPCSIDRHIIEQVRDAAGPPTEVARRFGVGLALVHQIRNGQRWLPDTQAHRAEYINAIAERVRANA